MTNIFVNKGKHALQNYDKGWNCAPPHTQFSHEEENCFWTNVSAMSLTFLNSLVVDCVNPFNTKHDWKFCICMQLTLELSGVRVATFSEFCKEFHREVNLLHGCQEVWISCGEIAPLCFTFLHRHQALNQQKWGFWPGNVSIFFKLWTSHVKLLPTIFQVLLEMKKSANESNICTGRSFSASKRKCPFPWRLWRSILLHLGIPKPKNTIRD